VPPEKAVMEASRRRPVAAGLMMGVLAMAAGGGAGAPASGAPRAGESAPIRIAVDASEAPRKIFRARLTIPAQPGPLTLLYPKWIPGHHRPSGPIAELAGLRISSAGRPVPWKRDPLDMYAFRVEAPPGTTALEVQLDHLAPTREKYRADTAATARLAILSWQDVLLYPAGPGADRLTFQASLRLPPGWTQSTALPVASEKGERIEYRAVSLETLVDSPVIMGRHFRSYPLLQGQTPPHRLDIVAETEAAAELAPELVRGFERLVAEAGALFGARPYRAYRWLLSLSDRLRYYGLEHHESSDNRMAEKTLSEEGGRRALASLLAHEYAHSWNAKYRRPAALVTPDYQQPWDTSLLWIYEGLTNYLGAVLPARAGLWRPEDYLDALAADAATIDHHRGRDWRPLADTAASYQSLAGLPETWRAWRRGADFYDEGTLLWLEADVLIRGKSGGRRSLDDFLRAFHGGQNGPAVKPYTLEDVIAALGEVQPHGWGGFWTERVQTVRERAPLGGIEGGGWRLVYNDAPNIFIADAEKADKTAKHMFSIGLTLQEDGTIQDVVPGLPAARAGAAPGMKVIAVNGRRFTTDHLRDAIRASKSAPIELLVENDEYFTALKLDYRGGLRYPHLERDPARPDLLSEGIRPRGS
jgi:predicted metalloprotease with PDZ domain